MTHKRYEKLMKSNDAKMTHKSYLFWNVLNLTNGTQVSRNQTLYSSVFAAWQSSCHYKTGNVQTRDVGQFLSYPCWLD